MANDSDVTERTVIIRAIDEEACRRLNGLFEKDEAVCMVRVREFKSRPGEMEIIKLRREDYEFR